MHSSHRILAIDAFRAVTMLLMIWVNDFWSLSEVPRWLEHMPADVDSLGFSDIIFPAFLFIVGLSIPFAQQARIQKGDSHANILIHIASRSLSLVIMGVLMVNLENYGTDAALLPRPLWQVLMTIGFILIWNRYPNKPSKLIVASKFTGVAIIIVLLICFRSNATSGYNWIEPHWWGILGLIGWSYLIAATIQLYSKNKVKWVTLAWCLCSAFTIIDLLGFFDWLDPIRKHVWIISSGALPTLTLAGCLASTYYLQCCKSSKSPRENNRYALMLLAAGIATLLLGFLLRPYWGISKIYATPAWVHICTGISLSSYAFLYWLVDTKQTSDWIRWISPAGTATLTCYLVPYLVYPILQTIGLELPSTLTTSWPGLAQSMLFAFAVVWITGGLTKMGVKLKL